MHHQSVGLIWRVKLLLVSSIFMGGCFVQGMVTIFLLSGAASLLGGTRPPVFLVFAGIWIIGMVVLMVWFIRWLIMTLGRRFDRVVDSAAERIVDQVGLGSIRDDRKTPESDDVTMETQAAEFTPRLVELDVALAPPPSVTRRRASGAPKIQAQEVLAPLDLAGLPKPWRG